MSGRRVALLVGIVDYEDDSLPALESTAKDVEIMKSALETHWDTSDNFEVIPKIVRLYEKFTAPHLVTEIESALDGASHFLFYFAGHGIPGKYGLQLATPEKKDNYDSGIFFDAILHRINGCDADEVTIILDCCHAGLAGDTGIADAFRWTQLREGVTVLAATEAEEEAWSDPNSPGRFTEKLAERLESRESPTVTVLDLFSYAAAADLEGQTPVLRTFGSMFSPLRAESKKVADVHAHKRALARGIQL